MTDRDREDPLGIEADRAKAGETDPDEGPPMAQMATTYGTSFVQSEEQAEGIATEPSQPTGPAGGNSGNPGGAAGSNPVSGSQQHINPGGKPR